MTPRVEVDIGELVLHGFDPRDRHAIGDAVQRELARLFAERGVPPGLAGGAEVDRVDAGAYPVRPPAGAAAAGAGLAETVYGGLGR
ncbi:MAG: hypothetical protein K2X87_09925 [Gemmataceae bacterium]|nr:hypothetical protein [Gemmataceae bacterium]